MKNRSNPADRDTTSKFIFAGSDIRGETVHLDNAYSETLAGHDYPEPIARLLGEFLAAVTLLSTTIKFEGTLTLQASSDASVSLIMAQCSSAQEVRAIVHGFGDLNGDSFAAMLGGGRLAITIEPEEGTRYQGLVSLEGETLAEALESYFAQSEQLLTKLWLTSDGQQSAGLLLQQLPVQLMDDPTEREEHWEHICHLGSTVTERELLTLPAEELLYRLYHQEDIQRFEPRPVCFRCSCSRERTSAALTTVPRVELEDILIQDGVISMRCEFCNTEYEFDARQISRLFGDPKPDQVH